jgi:predicted dehydrogenase
MLKRIAIIGYGNIAKKHIEVLHEKGCEIVASCNRSSTKNELARAEAGIQNTYTDYHQMIKDTQPDGILVCVNYLYIYKVLSEIIPYQIPVLCEKPSGTSYAEHMELMELSKKHNTPVMVALNRRHYSVFRKGIELVGGKDCITTVLLEWSEDPERLKANKNYSDVELSKLTFGNTIHGLDILTFYAGSVKDFHFNKSNKTRLPYHWIYNVSGISENGVVFNFNCSWDNPVPWRVVIYGNDFRLDFAPLETATLTKGGVKQIIPPDDVDLSFKAGFMHQAELFLNQNINGYDLSSCVNAMWLAEEINNQLQ